MSWFMNLATRTVRKPASTRALAGGSALSSSCRRRVVDMLCSQLAVQKLLGVTVGIGEKLLFLFWCE